MSAEYFIKICLKVKIFAYSGSSLIIQPGMISGILSRQLQNSFILKSSDFHCKIKALLRYDFHNAVYLSILLL